MLAPPWRHSSKQPSVRRYVHITSMESTCRIENKHNAVDHPAIETILALPSLHARSLEGDIPSHRLPAMYSSGAQEAEAGLEGCASLLRRDITSPILQISKICFGSTDPSPLVHV